MGSVRVLCTLESFRNPGSFHIVAPPSPRASESTPGCSACHQQKGEERQCRMAQEVLTGPGLEVKHITYPHSVANPNHEWGWKEYPGCGNRRTHRAFGAHRAFQPGVRVQHSNASFFRNKALSNGPLTLNLFQELDKVLLSSSKSASFSWLLSCHIIRFCFPLPLLQPPQGNHISHQDAIILAMGQRSPCLQPVAWV